jgi:hypothetical protein
MIAVKSIYTLNPVQSLNAPMFVGAYPPERGIE